MWELPLKALKEFAISRLAQSSAAAFDIQRTHFRDFVLSKMSMEHEVPRLAEEEKTVKTPASNVKALNPEKTKKLPFLHFKAGPSLKRPEVWDTINPIRARI